MSRGRTLARALAAALLAPALAACGSSEDPAGAAACDPVAVAPTVAWKRTEAVMADLGRALALTPDEVCQELGTTPCATVHRVALGASDPFERALYKPFAEPLGTTPIALERAVLHACVRRVELDRSAGQPVVFTHMDLLAPSAGAELGPDSPFGKDAAEVGRRLLGRDLLASELAELEALAVDDAGAAVASDEVAKLICFTLGTSREFLFF
jgi:hypothetical protein